MERSEQPNIIIIVITKLDAKIAATISCGSRATDMTSEVRSHAGQQTGRQSEHSSDMERTRLLEDGSADQRFINYGGHVGERGRVIKVRAQCTALDSIQVPRH